jgi:hypothetical protein
MQLFQIFALKVVSELPAEGLRALYAYSLDTGPGGEEKTAVHFRSYNGYGGPKSYMRTHSLPCTLFCAPQA